MYAEMSRKSLFLLWLADFISVRLLQMRLTPQEKTNSRVSKSIAKPTCSLPCVHIYKLHGRHTQSLSSRRLTANSHSNPADSCLPQPARPSAGLDSAIPLHCVWTRSSRPAPTGPGRRPQPSEPNRRKCPAPSRRKRKSQSSAAAPRSPCQPQLTPKR